MKKKLILPALLTALYACGCAGRPAASESTVPEYVFTYADNQSSSYPTIMGAYRFAELVKERTGGRIEIEVEANAVLGDEEEIVEQLAFGGVDFTRASLSTLSNLIPMLNVLQMPFLYRNSKHKWEVLDSEIGDTFLDAFDGSGMVALSWYDAGSRNFYTTERPITCLEDMQGMTIRVIDSSLMVDMVKALGAVPATPPFKDVYSALQTGSIDGAENNWPSYESMKHYEIASYYTIDEHTQVPEVQLCSQDTWNRLNSEDQAVIRECARESALYEREVWAQREKESRKKVEQAGVRVNTLSPEELLRFREAVEPLYEKYCGDYVEIIEEIQE